jgi:hypothetical protein
MSVEFLYPLVSEAIRRAELLADMGAPGVRDAYLEVSLLEERIAEALPVSDPEGVLARRGAVRAALNARDFGRVRLLTARFSKEASKAPGLRRELSEFTKQAEDEQTARFPLAAARYGLAELQRLGQAFFQQGAPFPIGS